MVGELKQHANQLGLPFGERHKTYNSRLAQELGFWAEEMGCGHAFHMAVFRAYFAEGKNIATLSVLKEIVKQCGISVTEAESVINERRYSSNVDADWELSRKKRITAVPTFVLGETQLVGAQSYSNLQGLVLQYGVDRR